MTGPRRIAMWSGPRNLSTAMMYAFAARGDCSVWDEPFYASYLRATGIDHPMRDVTLAADNSDAQSVALACAGAVAESRPVFYQKHMCQHMVDGIPRGWISAVTNVFLIRHPARVMASFAAKYESARLADIGFVQQAELFDEVAGNTGKNPIVVDSADIRKNPRAMLIKLCEALSIPFAERMLNWPAGPKIYDGPWAPVWYGSVHRSTGFAGQEGPLPELSEPYAQAAEAALPYYERLSAFALKP